MLSVEVLAEQVQSLGYPFFTKGMLNLNLIGIRNRSHRSETFDDLFCLVYREAENSPLLLKTFAMTTDPGAYYLQHPMKVEGTAILCPQQARGAYTIGKHRGVYPALVQNKPVLFTRDNDLDADLDITGPVHVGNIGANIHHASAYKKSTEVGKYSAACQVFADPDDYDFYWRCVLASSKYYGKNFTYTLLDDWGVL